MLGTIGYVLLSTPRLTAQGLYYDELHQACAAFAYKGLPPKFFAPVDLWNVPLMNMAYSGALKSGLYGVYLSVMDASFDVRTYRLLGIVLVGLGLIFFGMFLRTRMRTVGLLVFLSLFVTDQTVLLAVRHDWGPVALSLALRLCLLSLWLRAELRNHISATNTFLLAMLTCLLVFEKLSAVVLIPPLVVMLLWSPSRRTPGHFFALIAGGIVGSLPLVVANLAGYFRYGVLLSFMKVAGPGFEWERLPKHLFNVVSLGSGGVVELFIFGPASPPATIATRAEAPLLLALIGLGLATALISPRRHAALRLATIAFGSYVLVGFGLAIIPNPTAAQHWALATPFHYVGIALIGLHLHRFRRVRSHGLRVVRTAFVLLLAALLMARVIGVVAVERSLFQGRASAKWDPSLTRLGEIAAVKARDSTFIAADWGVATQIYCLADGDPAIVHELFWEYRGTADLYRTMRDSGRSVAYLVMLRQPARVAWDNTQRIVEDMEQSPAFVEVEVESELAQLAAVRVRKFLWTTSNLETNRDLGASP